MRIESVTAHAFGPLHGETLDFGDGLTIVFGPNESAKSSWHVATYAAVCGRPSGHQNTDWEAFERRHRPWGGNEWLVETRLRLDDGRQVRLRQNLDNKADRQATDLITGANVAQEIMRVGAPDAAVWLGLDRDSFRATAYVAQADILKVRDSAQGLQSLLQAAAATAGRGGPIDAITRLRRFQAEHVGTDRTPTKPLRLASTAHTKAKAALEQAQRDHRAYEDLLAKDAQARAELVRTRAYVAREEWAIAAASAAALRERFDAATLLTNELADSEVANEANDSAIVSAVTVALHDWHRVPATVGSGSSSSLIAETPGGLSEDDFWRLVSDLQVHIPERNPAAVDRLSRARQRASAVRRTSSVSTWLTICAGLGTLGGVAVMVSRPSVGGVAVPAVTGVVALLGLLVLLLVRGRAAAAKAEVNAAETDLYTNSGAVRVAEATHDAAVARCAAAGLPADPAELRELALSRERQLAVDDRARDGQDEERQRAGNALLAAAALAQVDAITPAEAAWALTEWQQQQAVDGERRDHAHELRRRLAATLGERSLLELDHQASAAQLRAAQLYDAIGTDVTVADLDQYLEQRVDDSTGERLASSRALAGEAEVTAAAASGAAASATPMVSVAETEEKVGDAESELARVTELQETLSRTLSFMQAAQERVYRSIAPRLRDAVQAALPKVTSGRYVEATVDPSTLEVKVWGKGGAPRPAHLLSFGTAEQIYLLLRIALADHLVTDGMSCPLILDDVTVHADRERTTSLLQLLLAESRRRQIIVFTQQEQVRDWAREHLIGGSHAVLDLPPVQIV